MNAKNRILVVFTFVVLLTGAFGALAATIPGVTATLDLPTGWGNSIFAADIIKEYCHGANNSDPSASSATIVLTATTTITANSASYTGISLTVTAPSGTATATTIATSNGSPLGKVVKLCMTATTANSWIGEATTYTTGTPAAPTRLIVPSRVNNYDKLGWVLYALNDGYGSFTHQETCLRFNVENPQASAFSFQIYDGTTINSLTTDYGEALTLPGNFRNSTTDVYDITASGPIGSAVKVCLIGTDITKGAGLPPQPQQ